LWRIESNLERKIIVNNQVIANALATQVDEILFQAEKIMIVTRGMVQKKLVTAGNLDAALATIVEAFPAFSRLQIVDNQGIVRHCSRGEDSWIGYDLSRSPTYLSALDRTDFFWSLSHIPVKGKMPSITVSMKSNNFVVIGYLDLAELSSNVGALASKAGIRAIILDRRGTVTASSEPGQAEYRLNLLNLPFVKKSLQGELISGRRYDEHGTEAIVSVAEIKTADLLAVIFRDAAQALAPVTFVRKVFLISMCLACLVAILVIIYVYHRIKGPLAALSDYTGQVADGQYDLLASNQGLQEFDHLEHNFLRMTEAISAREGALKEARETAEVAARAKSVFLANMSHELRTPLNAVIGIAELMTRDSSISSEQQGNLTTIVRSGEHLLSLINSVLEISKIEAGRVLLHKEHFDLHRLLIGIEEMFRFRARQKGLFLKFELTEVPRYVLADQNKLSQILINLLGNAVKFTESGGVILRITIKKNGSKNVSTVCSLHFEVIDTGPGIAKNDQDRVFEAFIQAGDRQDMVQQGTGLGLSISQEFVGLMGGCLDLKSAPGSGSTFLFTIDVQIVDREGVQPSIDTLKVTGLKAGQPISRLRLADENKKAEMSDHLMRKAIADLPGELNKNFKAALDRVDFDQAIALIKEIQKENEALANALVESLNGYQFDMLQKLFEGAKQS